jgi:hypothetical protein
VFGTTKLERPSAKKKLGALIWSKFSASRKSTGKCRFVGAEKAFGEPFYKKLTICRTGGDGIFFDFFRARNEKS